MSKTLNLRPADVHAFANVSSTVVTVTAAEARSMRASKHFERQRNISPVNVARLAREMETGTFTPGTQIFICVLPDGSERIVNGNHTLEAIAACGVPQLITLTRLKVRDLDHCGRVYAVFDIQKVRTWRDSLRATGAGDTLPLAPAVLSAVGVIEARFGYRAVEGASRISRINRLEDYRESAELFAMAADGAPRQSAKLVQRAGVMAVALETLKYQPSRASEFWMRVMQDDGLTSGMPEKALLSWLRNVRAGGGLSMQREHCKAAAMAWNAAYREERRDYVKPNAVASFYLLGTPLDKGFESAGA